MGTIQEIEITTRVIRPPEIPIQAVRQPAAAVRQATGTAAAAQHQEMEEAVPAAADKSSRRSKD